MLEKETKRHIKKPPGWFLFLRMYGHKTVYTIYESIGRLNTGSTWSSKLYHKHVSKSDVLDWAVGIQRAISPWTFLIGIKVLRDRTEHYFGLVGNSRTHKSFFFLLCFFFLQNEQNDIAFKSFVSNTHTKKKGYSNLFFFFFIRNASSCESRLLILFYRQSIQSTVTRYRIRH